MLGALLVQFNYKSGEPAPESITNKIYDQTVTVSCSPQGLPLLSPLADHHPLIQDVWCSSVPQTLGVRYPSLCTRGCVCQGVFWLLHSYEM